MYFAAMGIPLQIAEAQNDNTICSIYEQLVKEQFAREETDSTLCDLYEAMLSL